MSYHPTPRPYECPKCGHMHDRCLGDRRCTSRLFTQPWYQVGVVPTSVSDVYGNSMPMRVVFDVSGRRGTSPRDCRRRARCLAECVARSIPRLQEQAKDGGQPERVPGGVLHGPQYRDIS